MLKKNLVVFIKCAKKCHCNDGITKIFQQLKKEEVKIEKRNNEFEKIPQNKIYERYNK